MGLLHLESDLACECELNVDGMRFALEILADQAKVAPPDPLKYVDQSHLQQTIRELGEQ